MLEKKETETQKDFEERLRNKVKEIDIDSHNRIREIINIIKEPDFGKINVLEELHQIREVREKVYSIIHNYNKSRKISYTLSYILIDKTFKEVEDNQKKLEEDNFWFEDFNDAYEWVKYFKDTAEPLLLDTGSGPVYN